MCLPDPAGIHLETQTISGSFVIKAQDKYLTAVN